LGQRWKKSAKRTDGKQLQKQTAQQTIIQNKQCAPGDKIMAINYEELRKIELSEKRSAQLYKLPQDFYLEASSYLKALQSSLESFKQSGDDAAHRKIPMLEDQIYNTRESIKNVYEMREKKLVALAISASRGVALDLGALSFEEKPVYDRLLDLMRGAREELLFCRKNTINPPTPPVKFKDNPQVRHDAGLDTPSQPAIKFSTEEAQVAKVSVTVPTQAATIIEPPIQKIISNPAPNVSVTACVAEAPKPAAGTDYVTIRVIEELPTFVGNDGKKYALKKGDVASIHKANASILEKHRKVEFII
jgi:DNA replication initiation complex subunit (GINS family)